MILIQVLKFSAVMHPVVTGRIKDPFKNRREFADQFCVHPAAIQQANLFQDDHQHRVKSHKRHPDPKQEFTTQYIKPGMPQANRQVELFGGVVHRMRGP